MIKTSSMQKRNRARPRTYSGILLLISLLILPYVAEGGILENVVDKLQNTYRSIDELSATFHQETVTRAGTRSAGGIVYFKKPGKMRWEYRYGNDDLIISDGRTIWIYQPDLNQVIKGRLDDNIVPMAQNLLAGITTLNKDFGITMASAGKETYSLSLTPRTRISNIENLLIEVDGKDFLVLSTTIKDPFHNKTTIRFSDIQVNIPLGNELFRFNKPDGVTVIRP